MKSFSCHKTPHKLRSRQTRQQRQSEREDEMRDFNDQARPPPNAAEHRKELFSLIRGLSYRHSQWQVFSDFVEMGALALSNAVDLAQRETRETRYMEIVGRYRPDEVQQFPRMMAALTMALEGEVTDVLGATFHELELHNKWTGQFFTPYALCKMMARATIGDRAELEERIKERGFLSASEPAAGSGAMVIALADEMRGSGINYQQHLHVTAVDVDAKCVHMAYLQFSLLHIPAVIIHGNTLSLEEYGHWYTPAHILDGWSRKRSRQPAATLHEIAQAPSIPAVPQADDTHEPPSGLPPAPPMQLKLF